MVDDRRSAAQTAVGLSAPSAQAPGQGGRAPQRPPLTAKQSAILATISRALQTHGYPPSVREIGAAVGLASPASVTHQLRSLQQKGYLRRDPNRPRALELVTPLGDGPRVSERPGSTPTWFSDLAGGLAGGERLLRMPDDSMVEAAILPGDWLVIRADQPPQNGAIVAAEISGVLTARTIRIRGRTTLLVPQNAQLEPIGGAEAKLVGIVVAVVRQLVETPTN